MCLHAIKTSIELPTDLWMVTAQEYTKQSDGEIKAVVELAEDVKKMKIKHAGITCTLVTIQDKKKLCHIVAAKYKLCLLLFITD